LGPAAVIDPSVSPEVYVAIAKKRGWSVRYVFETHVHADHLSRARELAKRTDATLLLPYVSPSATIATPTPRLAELLAHELGTVASHVRRGIAWTTDAPCRETPDQLRLWAERGVLAVEMPAASLFAFAHARAANVATVALVSNGVDQVMGQFDTGGHAFRTDVLAAVARAAHAFMMLPTERHTVEETRRQPQN
jgi:purine nucleoside phosphorylase